MNDKQRIDGLAQCVQADGRSIGIHPPGAHNGSPSRWMVAITDAGRSPRYREYQHDTLRGAIDQAIEYTLGGEVR